MSIKELSLKLAAVSLIADEAKRTKDRLRAELQAEMDAIGADRIKAELGDEVVAYVTTTKPKFKWQVVSEQSFTRWVKENYPTEIVETVRESSREVILNKFNFNDDVVIDPNGEVVDWLVGEIADPYLTTKFQADGRVKLRDAMIGLNASYELNPAKILELE